MRAATQTSTNTLTVDDLTVRFTVGKQRGSRREPAQQLTAVDSVTLRLPPAASLGIVGESGSGKSTLARAIAGLTQPTAGQIRLGPTILGTKRDRKLARRIQMVFQDPASSLNPRLTVRRMLRELLSVHRMLPAAQIPARMSELLSLVELPEAVFDRRPRHLSGGQRQRLGIARALALQPDVLILDEPISALDVSVQAAVLILLRRLQAELGYTMIFISHDLGAVRGLCDDVAVMYLGRVVESGPVESVLAQPDHPYTRALIAAEPDLDHPRPPGAAGLPGEPPSPIDRPDGCAFRSRCPIAIDDCARHSPALVEHHRPGTGHRAACLRVPPPAAAAERPRP